MDCGAYFGLVVLSLCIGQARSALSRDGGKDYLENKPIWKTSPSGKQTSPSGKQTSPSGKQAIQGP